MHDEASQDVGDGEEEEQAGGGGVDDVAENLACTLRGRDEVGVGEGYTLRGARGAGGVDDRGDIMGRDRAAAAPHVLNCDVRGGSRDGAQRTPVEGVDPDRVRGGDGAHQVGLLGGRGKDAGDVRVGENVFDLGGGVGLVDGYRDRADGEESEV